MGSIRHKQPIDIHGKPLFGPKMVRNPFLEYPGKLDCWCGSGKKAAVCCLPKMAEMIPEKDAAIGIAYMKYVKEKLSERKGWRPERAERKLRKQRPMVE